MEPETLVDLAKAARQANARVGELAREHFPEACPLIEREDELLDALVTELEMREENVAALTSTLADRLNNLLMAVQTASDLLRTTPADELTIIHLCRQMENTVCTGRESLKTLQDAVGELR